MQETQETDSSKQTEQLLCMYLTSSGNQISEPNFTQKKKQSIFKKLE